MEEFPVDAFGDRGFIGMFKFFFYVCFEVGELSGVFRFVDGGRWTVDGGRWWTETPSRTSSSKNSCRYDAKESSLNDPVKVLKQLFFGARVFSRKNKGS